MEQDIRDMCRDIRNYNLYERTYLTEETKSLDKSDEIVKGFIQDIYEQIGNVSVDFANLLFNKDLKQVKWSGTLSGISWSVMYSDQENGFYISTDNEKVTTDQTKALHKLNLYFNSMWFKAIRDAIMRNELG